MGITRVNNGLLGISATHFPPASYPVEALAEFLTKYNTTLVVSYGTVMKEYAAAPPALLAQTKELKKYFKASYDYISGLKPKPTKKAAPVRKKE